MLSGGGFTRRRGFMVKEKLRAPPGTGGKSASGLPIGLQIAGRWYDEGCLFAFQGFQAHARLSTFGDASAGATP